jgi:hypothetical protein
MMDIEDLDISDDDMKMLKNVGFPSLQEYVKNPAAWRERLFGRHDEVLHNIDKGSESLNRHEVSKRRFEVDGYECRSLEHLSQVVKDQGLSFKDLDLKPYVKDIGGGKCEIVVRFVRKGIRAEGA